MINFFGDVWTKWDSFPLWTKTPLFQRKHGKNPAQIEKNPIQMGKEYSMNTETAGNCGNIKLCRE